MKISIPEPCHEDWNKMTPKQQGSFCGICSKVVVDFTKLKKAEIKQYFIDKKDQKTCGRFNSDQLNINLNTPTTYNRSYLSRFAFALYITFGMSLFSCSTEEHKTISEDSNKPEQIIDSSTHLIDSNYYTNIEIGDIVISESADSNETKSLTKKGEVAIHNTPIHSCNLAKPNGKTKDSTLPSPTKHFIKGDTIIWEPEEPDAIIRTPDIEIEPDNIIIGKPAIDTGLKKMPKRLKGKVKIRQH